MSKDFDVYDHVGGKVGEVRGRDVYAHGGERAGYVRGDLAADHYDIVDTQLWGTTGAQSSRAR